MNNNSNSENNKNNNGCGISALDLIFISGLIIALVIVIIGVVLTLLFCPWQKQDYMVQYLNENNHNNIADNTNIRHGNNIFWFEDWITWKK